MNELIRRFFQGALIYFVAVGILGTLLRLKYVIPVLPGLHFSNLVHAHSHVAYFGWSSLALFGAIYSLLPRLTGRPLQQLHVIRWQLIVTHVATIGALITFALGGYNPLSIIFSTMNVILWYVFMGVYRKNIKGLPRPLPVALRYFNGAVILLFISSLGTWLISAMTATGASDLGREAGLNIFLTNFTDGWLLLGLLGVAVALLTPPGEGASGRWAAGPLPWIMVLTPLTFLAELVPLDVPVWALLIGLGARFALVIPYGWFIWNGANVYRERRPLIFPGIESEGGGASSRTLRAFVTAAVMFFIAKVNVHGILGLAPVVPTRQIFVAYLHLDLLGFVSCGLLAATYFSIRKLFPNVQPDGGNQRLGYVGMWCISIGLTAMVGVLAAVGIIGSTTDEALRATITTLLQSAFAFGLLALVGIVLSATGLWRDLARTAGSE